MFYLIILGVKKMASRHECSIDDTEILKKKEIKINKGVKKMAYRHEQNAAPAGEYTEV